MARVVKVAARCGMYNAPEHKAYVESHVHVCYVL